MSSKRMKSTEAAAYLGYADATMRDSRVTGKLCGVDAPLYQRIGSRVFYDQDQLDAWMQQFPMTRHTGEYRFQLPVDTAGTATPSADMEDA